MAVKTTKAAAKSPTKPPANLAAAKNAPKAAKAPPAKGTAKPATAITMTQKHLAAELAEQHDLPRKQAEMLVTELFGMVVTHLKSGHKLRLAGVGILEVKNRPARMGRNPGTGEAIEIKASKKVAFRAAKELKEAI